jgi:hypothetical protein
MKKNRKGMRKRERMSLREKERREKTTMRSRKRRLTERERD